MRLIGADSTRQLTPDAGDVGHHDDTELSPGPRGELLAGPEYELRRRAVEAALFGGTDAPKFGAYRLLHRLGEGGMGSVHAAYDDRLDRKVAIKLIRTSRLDSAEVRERTRREARALARLSHPNVVHVYEVGEAEGQLFVAMEFLAGPTLRTWLDAEKRPWQQVLAVLRQAGEGLAAAHAQDIIHRDFKPQNAMFGADGRVRVLDFGLARMGEAEEPRPDAPPEVAAAYPLTLTGTVLGTPAYMAPEQFLRHTADARSDQFSFCVTLYEGLYGRRPFAGATLTQIAEHAAAGRVAARPKDTPVPLRIHEALLRGLDSDPAKRWPSMQALLAELARTPAARLRRLVTSLALVAAASAASFALATSNSAAEQCPDARAELAGVWDEGRAAAVREALRRDHPAQASELLPLFEPTIERYAGQWVNVRNEACLAHAEGRQSTNVFDLRTACLDQRRASLDAVVGVLESAQGGQIHAAAQAMADLPSLERCGDVGALTATVAPPEDVRLRARVQAHREQLARAYVLEDVGRYAEGLALIDAVLADADALAYEPLKAEAYLYKGSLEMSSLDVEKAAASFDTALYTALSVGHDVVAALASSKRAFFYAMYSRDDERALAELPLVEALLPRARDDVDVYTEAMNNVGMVYLFARNDTRGRRALEEAHAWRAAHGRERTAKALATLINLAFRAPDQEGRYDMPALLTDIERATEAVAGSQGPLFVSSLQARATLHHRLGRPRASLDLLSRLDTLSRPLSARERIMRSFHLSMAIAIDQEDARSARRLLDELHAAGGPEPDHSHAIEHYRLLIAGIERNADAVQSHYDALRALLADPQLASREREAYHTYARAAERVDRLREAVAALERHETLDSWDSSYSDLEFARPKLDLGRLYRKLGEYDAAEARLAEVRADYELSLAPDAPAFAELFVELGELARARGRDDEAVLHLIAAESIWSATAESDYLPLARARFSLAQVLADDDAARARVEAALAAFRAWDRQDEASAAEAWLEQRG